MIENIPLPATDDPVDSPFWEGTRCSKLLIQSCSQCGEMRFPPRPMCPCCQSRECNWQAVSGRGRIWSFAVPESPLLPAFEALKPYVTALVELEENPKLRIVGPLLTSVDGDIKGVNAAQVAIGQQVAVTFKYFAEDVAMPCWVAQPENSLGESDNEY
ncbi:Zn-ribbon domain-containing OB-fold protein [Dasania marina]|uniref:Zn-ribbon domain-containing OB-fold protein n=1 Tax=Dasania marina TaxID=471499 RepID=UPI00037D4FDC|nr:OB-fold domain-containing protein [Dasania marina]